MRHPISECLAVAGDDEDISACQDNTHLNNLLESTSTNTVLQGPTVEFESLFVPADFQCNF